MRVTRTDNVAGGPLVATAPEGDVTVVWSTYRGVKSRTRQAGGEWGPALRVSAGAGRVHDVGVDATGDATVVWERSIPGQRQVVMAATRPDGGAWSNPRRLSKIPRSRGTYTQADSPDLDVSPDGAAVAAWSFGSEDGGPAHRAQASYRPAGGVWGRPVDVAKPPSFTAAAEISPAGVPLILVSDNGLRTLRRTSDGWHRVGGIVATHEFYSSPDLKIGPGGHAVAVWDRWHGRRSRPRITVHASRLLDGNWRSPLRLSGPLRSEFPHLGVDAQGVSTATWSTPRGLKAARWVPGNSPTEPRTIVRGNASGQPLVAPNGSAAIVGLQGRRRETRLFAVTRPLGGTWSARQQISTVRGYLDEFGADIWPGGRAVAVWQTLSRAGKGSGWISWKR